MATVNLGSIKFKWKGTYAGGTAYTIDDVVSYNGSSYICIQASTGNLPTNATYFEQMSSAGTNGTDGTDLTTTLSTQGDIVYRDASGLARLGAGTSGQVLQTNGTGANPSWGTVSSDYVKLADLSWSGASSTSIDGYFSSTYKDYKIFLTSTGSGGGSWIQLRVNVGGTEQTSGYYQVSTFSYVLSGAVGTGQNSGWNDSESYIARVSGETGRPSSGQINIYNPLSTTLSKTITTNFGNWNSTSEITIRNGVTIKDSASALSGITLSASTGTLTGTATLYGLK